MLLPKRTEAEKAILSTLMHHPDMLVEAMDELELRDFYEITSQQIWNALVSLYTKETPIDIISLRDEIKKNDLGNSINISEVFEFTSEYYGSSNLKNYIEQVKNASLLRDLVGLGVSFTESSQAEDAEADNILQGLEKEIASLNEGRKEKRPTDSEGIISELEDDIANAEKYNWRGFDTGFKALDERTGGFIPTHVWVLGAYTGVGKTFFTIQIILNILRNKAKVALFSTEMDRKMTLLRMIGNIAGLGTIKMLKGDITETEKLQIAKAKEELVSFKDQLSVFDSVYRVDEIRTKAKKIKLQKGLDVVFIDFIQNLRGSANIYERMSEAALALQQLAQELKITIVMVSQVNQQSAGWKSKESIDYKGAGEIAAVADVGLWITKNEQFKDLRDVHLRKVRHGANTTFATKLGFPSGRLQDLSEETGKYIKSDKAEPMGSIETTPENDQIKVF